MPKSLLTRPWALGALALILVALSAAALWRAAPDPDVLLERSRVALKLGNYEEAERLAVQIPQGASEYNESRLIAGEAATKRGQLGRALDYYLEIDTDDRAAWLQAQSYAGDLYFHSGRPSEAARCYRRVLSERAEDAETRSQLVQLLNAFGQRWDSLPHLLALARANRLTVEQLFLLGNPDPFVELPENIETYGQTAPDDPLPMIHLAAHQLREGDSDSAVELLRRAVQSDPSFMGAWSELGHALLESTPETLDDWNTRLPEAAEEHPDIWVVRGLWAREQGDLPSAVRCFWEAVKRMPESRTAAYQLGQGLTILGEDEKAAVFLAHAAKLEQLGQLIGFLYQARTDPFFQQSSNGPSKLMEAARLTESLGRIWEAQGWYRLALGNSHHRRMAESSLELLRSRLTPELPQTAPEMNPALRVDLSEYPLPAEWTPRAPNARIATADSGSGGILFTRTAVDDLRHFYSNSADPPSKGGLIVQQVGGGVAVLDYDGDGWPDLYLPQGGELTPESASGTRRDRLYRNLGNGRFTDAGTGAGLDDREFSHAAAVGDFDSDGFDDIYVGNLGRNRLYRSNGDGTFTDATDGSDLFAEDWTTSCAMVDVNGDALPDLFDVNYAMGDDLLTKTCGSASAVRSCHPSSYVAAPDRLFLNLGNGRFQEVTEECGLVGGDGRGLGVLAADFNGTGRVSLFVANDTTANFLFVNETESRGGLPAFTERALEFGLAFDRDGRAQACMGIAADDADGDGLIDLFVTNYYRESNTFYRQISGRVFSDGTREAGLREPSMAVLGWGTQFLDADLDGWPDLVVANGHVGDFTDEGTPYAMRPQFFRNEGSGRFVELAAESLGEYFCGEYLGRGLARLDWNRDGREEFAVSHLDAPFVLLTNETSTAGRFLAIRLAGTHMSRDAIGATVQVTAGGRTRTRQLTGGDGFAASNQRRLIFGLGSAEKVDGVAVVWPSGLRQILEQLPPDQELLLIEGRADALSLAR